MDTFVGTVEFFDDHRAIGIIAASTGEKIKFIPRAIIGRSLRTMCKGERVRATAYLSTYPREWRADQVTALSADDSPERDDPTSSEQETTVTSIGGERSYYWLRSADRDRVYLHSSKILRPLPKPLQVGDRIFCIVISTPLGYQAVLPPEGDTFGTLGPLVQPPSTYYLSQAILNRDGKQYDKARRFYEDGLREAPSHILYSSYAAMERNLNNFGSAIRILRQAVQRYPKVGKFYEDLGNLLYNQGAYGEAVSVLNDGLRFAPRHRVLHRFLARALLSAGGDDNLKLALREYEESKSSGVWYDEDELPYKRLLVQLRHPRGARALAFFGKSRLRLKAVDFHRQPTYAVDFIVVAGLPEHIESYSLREDLFVRCYNQGVVGAEDIQDLLENRCRLLNEAGVSQEVLFVVVQTSDGIRDYLYRLNDQLTYPTVVPLQDATLRGGAESFREALDDWLFRRDLYDYHYPVSGRKFYGRETEIKRITDAIEDREWVGIFGLRRIGKTSLIEEIARRRSGDVVASCDLLKHASMPSCNYLMVEIARQFDTQLAERSGSIYKRLRSQLTLLPHARALLDDKAMDGVILKFDHDIEAIRAAFTSAHLRLPRFLVILDEVERLLPLHNQPGIPGYDSFLSYLRGDSQRRKALSLLVVGANPMICEMGKWGEVDNPLFEFIKSIYLPPFPMSECSDMAVKLGRGMGIEYDDEALVSLYAETGGHPYIVRQYCSFISKRFPNRPLRVSPGIVCGCADDFVFERSHVFQEILERLDRDFPLEKDLLGFIVDGVSSEKELGELAGQPGQDALRHLLGYQLVQRCEDGNYIVHIGLLQRWLQKSWRADTR